MAEPGKPDTGSPDGTIIERLFRVIPSRRGDDPGTSNTARPFARGCRKIAAKVGEEAAETKVEPAAPGKLRNRNEGFEGVS